MASDAVNGLLGAAAGVGCAVVAVVLGRRASESPPTLRETLGLTQRGQYSVERHVIRNASAFAFPVYVVSVLGYAWLELDSASVGWLSGLAGLVFGTAAAVHGARSGGR